MISEADRLTIEALVRDMVEARKKKREKTEWYLADPEALDLAKEREYIEREQQRDLDSVYPDWDYITHK